MKVCLYCGSTGQFERCPICGANHAVMWQDERQEDVDHLDCVDFDCQSWVWLNREARANS